MRKAILVGAEWCPGCKAAKPFVEDVCTKLGYVFIYEDLDHSAIAKDIIDSNGFRTLPVLCYVNDNNTEEDVIIRYKVGGFDFKGIQSFLMDENDLNLREDDIKNMEKGV